MGHAVMQSLGETAINHIDDSKFAFSRAARWNALSSTRWKKTANQASARRGGPIYLGTFGHEQGVVFTEPDPPGISYGGAKPISIGSFGF